MDTVKQHFEDEAKEVKTILQNLCIKLPGLRIRVFQKLMLFGNTTILPFMDGENQMSDSILNSALTMSHSATLRGQPCLLSGGR
jgi:hypothetical protein